MKLNPAKKTLILAGFIILKFFLQYFLISPEYDLQRDEYLYLDQANHLAWGYLSVPPVTSWLSLIVKFLGNGEFWVKFFPALFGVLTLVVVWKAIEELKGNMFALILGATSVVFSSLLRLNLLFQPNSLDVLCWTFFYYILIKYINTQKQKWLFIGAIVFAIGFLNKYNFAFLLTGLLPAVLISEQRKIFAKKELYLSLSLGLLLILPNLLWQYSNGFPVVHHMKQLSELQLVHVDRWNFLREQIFFFLGSLFVVLASLYALLLYPPFKSYRLFFWSIIFTLIIFVYLKAKAYYAIGLYPVYISFGSVFLGQILNTGWRTYLRPVAIALPLFSFIPMYKYVFPNRTPDYIIKNEQRYKELGMLRWEDGKDHAIPQDFADMLGWKALAEKVDSVCAGLPDMDKTLILCDNYGQAGAINYYTKNKKVIASSFNADYVNWLDLDQEIVDVILVKEGDDEDKDRTVEKPFFDSVYLATKRINQFAREDEISIYVLRGAKIKVNKRIKEEADRKKSFQ